MPITPTESLASPGADRWREIFGLLDTALELEPAARPAWLAALGPEHAALSPWLEDLLRTHAAKDTADFMRDTATSVLAGGQAPTPPGADLVVGPYRLLREIGQGGMATVWLAERADGLLERRVALKLPHVSWGMVSFADRMARERNILASLTHPNIARLYDAGLAADGRPYLALEYVDGRPIDAYAAAHALDVRARVALVVQVARAVAHAHARLVVHRDLKPSNILVDAEGVARLLDFGIARLVDPDFAALGDAQMTQAPGRALTPDYASPEQIRGEAIGTASDIYSLGVVAFELLAGDRPHRFAKGLSAAALAAAIDAAEPPRASARGGDDARSRQLKGDLDAILLRALAPASGERYATVDAFADDLERHLRGEPVRARPDSAWYRAERWVRRHKLESAVAVAIVIAVPAGAAAQAAVLAAIATGAGIALWQARVARRQALRATEEAARAAAVKAFLTSFFKSGSLEEDGGIQLGRLTVQQFVERGARKIDAGFADEPALKSELFDVVSALFADLSDAKATIEYARKWQQALQQTDAPADERARASQRWAQGLALAERNAEAVEVLASAVAGLRREKAARPSLLVLLLVDLARLRALLGDKQQAAIDAEAALALLATPEAADAGAAGAHAAAMFQRADLMALENQLTEAAPLFEEAIARMEGVHGVRSAIVGRHRYVFASALAEGRRMTEAERQYRAARLLFRDAGGDADLNAAIVELELGRLLAIAGAARGEGLELLGHARDVFSRRADAVSPLYPATAALYLAEARVEDGDLEAAREPIEAAAALFRDKVENTLMRTLAQILHARFLSECGEYEASNSVLEGTRDEYLRLVGAQHPHTASVVNRIGANHLRAEQFGRARALFESVVGSQDQDEQVWGSMKHMAQRNLALVQLEEGDSAAALPALQGFWDAYCATPAAGRNAMTEAGLCLNLGRALLACGRADAALPHLQRSVEVLVGPYPRGPGLAMGRAWLGLALLALGDEAGARRMQALAGATFAAQPSCGIHYRRGFILLAERLEATATAG